VINIEKRTLCVPSDARMRPKFTHGRADADAEGPSFEPSPSAKITRAAGDLHLMAIAVPGGPQRSAHEPRHTVAGGAEMVISLLTRAAIRSGV
jgi:hypothetical protein